MISDKRRKCQMTALTVTFFLFPFQCLIHSSSVSFCPITVGTSTAFFFEALAVVAVFFSNKSTIFSNYLRQNLRNTVFERKILKRNMSTTHIFNVEMSCAGCSGAVERVLNRLKGKGVDDVAISLPEQKVSVTSTLKADELLDVIKKTGKKTTYAGTQ